MFLKFRPFKYFFFKYFPFYLNAKKIKKNKNNERLKEFILSLSNANLDKIVVVASGPSSRKLKLSDKSLYLCTNDSIKLVDSKNYIYYIQDEYIVLRYLKFFKPKKYWSGTFCIVNNNGFNTNFKVFNQMIKYLNRYKREKEEFLFSDFKENMLYNSYYNELNLFLKKEFDFEFQTLNSGFSLLMLASYLAHVLNKPMTIYGLDFGFGGNEYFDGSEIDTRHCSFEKKNIEKMSVFYKALYKKSKVKIENYSFYNPNINNEISKRNNF